MVPDHQSYQWFPNISLINGSQTSVVSMVPKHQSYQWFANIGLIGSQTSVLAMVPEYQPTVTFKMPENLKGSIVKLKGRGHYLPIMRRFLIGL